MKKNQLRKDVVLWKDDVEWYNSHYPDTPLSNTLSLLLTEFRKLHGENTPANYAKVAAQELKRLAEGTN